MDLQEAENHSVDTAEMADLTSGITQRYSHVSTQSSGGGVEAMGPPLMIKLTVKLEGLHFEGNVPSQQT